MSSRGPFSSTFFIMPLPGDINIDKTKPPIFNTEYLTEVAVNS